MKDGIVKIYIGGESTNRKKLFLDDIVKENKSYVNKKKIREDILETIQSLI